jgi:low temperature requirement protein LtrA
MPAAGSVAQHLRPRTGEPSQHLSPGQAAVTLAGPIVYLAGELGFRQRMIHRGNPKRVLVIVVLLLLGAIAARVAVFVLALLVTALLTALGVWEYVPGGVGNATTPALE